MCGKEGQFDPVDRPILMMVGQICTLVFGEIEIERIEQRNHMRSRGAKLAHEAAVAALMSRAV